MPVPLAVSAKRAPLTIVLQFWAWAAVLRPLKRVLPFRMLVRLVRVGSRASRPRPGRAAAIVDYMTAVGRFPARPPANCLERSLAAYRMLRSAGSRPELRVGVRRVPDTGSLDGHVWLVLDGLPAERNESVREFTEVIRVDTDGRVESLDSTIRTDTRTGELRSAP